MTSIGREMEDNLNFKKWKTTSIFREMEDDLKFFRKWKTTSNFSENARPPQSVIPNISELFLLANVDSKFPIKNNLQLIQSQPSMT
jgi:hypothetical protein